MREGSVSDWSPGGQEMSQLIPMAGTWKLVSSEGVGLVLLDCRFPRSPDSRFCWCRALGAGETRAGVCFFLNNKSGSD